VIVGMSHTSFTVSDLDRSIAFYRDLLGFELVGTIRRRAEWIKEMTSLPQADLRIAGLRLEGGDHLLELIEYVSPRGEGPRAFSTNDVGRAHVGFTVTEIHAEYRRLSDAGVEFLSPPVRVGEPPSLGMWAAYFRDPDGIPLELQQPVADRP
jgi:catechol 2,3-dioxygenase-like lactoylglutathione lyase family enzyme